MALTEAEKRKIEEEERYRQQIASSVSTQHSAQKHGVPAILSFFIPGLGQIVKGQVGKGILIFIGVAIGLVFFVVPGAIIWIWQIIDAYNS